MKNENIETQIGALTNERIVLSSIASDSTDVNAFTLGILKEPSLKKKIHYEHRKFRS